MQHGLIKTSSEIDKLAAALCKAQSMYKTLKKSGFNPHFKSYFSTDADIDEATIEARTANGLSITQLPSGGGEGYVCVITQIMHTSGQFISGEMILPAKDSTPQSFGSALSYNKRYSKKMILGVTEHEDDDANEAQKIATTSYKPQATHNKSTADRNQFSHEPEDTEYRVGFGKFKGSRLNDIKNTDLVGYLDYLTKTSEQTGKEPSKFAKDFMEKAYAYLNAQTGLPKEDDKHFRSFDNIPPPDDSEIPF